MTFRAALQAIVALDFKKDGNGRDDFFSGADRFLRAHEIARNALGEGGDMEFQAYQDKRGGWRWRLVADNGLTVADSAEAYSRKSSIERAIDMIRDFGISMHNARIKYLEPDPEFQPAAKTEQTVGKVIHLTATVAGKNKRGRKGNG